jgi:hypothetical protein
VDKIYALFGLASISKNMPIVPDYARLAEDIFCEVTVAIIEEDWNLDVLSQVHRLEGEDLRVGWPTWAPDWMIDHGIYFLIDISNGLRPYDAGGKWTASYALIDPDTGGRLRSGWRKPTNPVRERVYDGLVRRPGTSPEQTGNSTGIEQVALVTPDGRTVVVPRNVPTRGRYTTALPNRRLQVHGVIWNSILWVSSSITKESLHSGDYKNNLKRWMGAIAKAVDPSQPEVRAIDFQLFMLTLLRGMVTVPTDAHSNQEAYQGCINYIVRKFLAWIGIISEERVGESPFSDIPVDFDRSIPQNVYGWKFCTTLNGSFGLVPSGAEIFDAVCIILGSSVPLVLRRKYIGEEWEQIGTGYFYHVMAGEVFELLRAGGARPQSFTLA